MDSPFDILGVDPDADDAAIVQAYRQRVKRAHPDHGGSVGEFQVVRAAYEQIMAGDSGDERTLGGDAASARPRPRTASVEYLNYEVLDDYGWSLDDPDLFEKAAAAGLRPEDYGTFEAQPHESLLEAAENRGFPWPFACRGGACANCAVAMCKGELSQPVDHILTDEMVDQGFRLSCNGVPLTDQMKVVYNVKHLPDLDELRLPPHPFNAAYAND